MFRRSFGEDRAEQFFPARSALGGERDQARVLSERERLADQRQIRLDLALFELVELVGHDEKALAAALEELRHRYVVRRGFVARVDDQDAEIIEILSGEELKDLLLKAGFDKVDIIRRKPASALILAHNAS